MPPAGAAIGGRQPRPVEERRFEVAVSVTKQTLADMRPGDLGRVISIKGTGLVQQRMLEMGVSPGADIEVLRRAPLGDPIEIHVRGFNLMLRLQEAALVQVGARA